MASTRCPAWRKPGTLIVSDDQVFESYVSVKLGKLLPDWRVSTQVHGQSLIEKHQGEGMFKLIPDRVVRKMLLQIPSGSCWTRMQGRKITASLRPTYQLFAYSSGTKESCLIYPRTDSFDKQLPPFWFQEKRFYTCFLMILTRIDWSWMRVFCLKLPTAAH